MLNSSYLLSLKKQKEVLQILSMSCIINLTFGLLFSRLLSYEDSAFGMLIASIFFTIVSFKENIKVLLETVFVMLKAEDNETKYHQNCFKTG